jgi:high-affinity nickel-transport protein
VSPVAPGDLAALVAAAFALGLAHGFDPDHLAAIDGLTRNARSPRVARFAGLLFSLGHGAIVAATAIAIAVLAQAWEPPAWLEGLGAVISIACLGAIGFLSLRAAALTPRGEPVRLSGLKGKWLVPLVGRGGALAVAGIGALFALSFDTLSQATFFALAASRASGWWVAGGAGLAFALGMMATDAANGLWVNRLIVRAGGKARGAARALAAAIGVVSLGVAALGAARLVFPAAESWYEGRELVCGAAVLLAVTASYLVVTRSRAAQAG